MTDASYLDIIAADGMLEDSTRIPKALAELDAIYAAEPFLGRLDARLIGTVNGWVAHYNSGVTTLLLGRHGNHFRSAEDAIAALRALIEKWRAEIDAENAKDNAA